MDASFSYHQYSIQRYHIVSEYILNLIYCRHYFGRFQKFAQSAET